MASLAQRVDATRGTVEGLELVLHETTPITLATEGVSEPWPRAIALDAAGLPADSAWPGRYEDETLLHLSAGRYDLVVERDGEEVARHVLEVGDEPLHINLYLK